MIERSWLICGMGDEMEMETFHGELNDYGIIFISVAEVHVGIQSVVFLPAIAFWYSFCVGSRFPDSDMY